MCSSWYPRSACLRWSSPTGTPPAQLIPLVEVVRGDKAPQEYADITVELLEKCGKSAVLMKKFIRGYIANRMQMCLNQELFYLLDNGYCTPEDIDKAVKTSFIPRAVVLGLCKRADFGGPGHDRQQLYEQELYDAATRSICRRLWPSTSKKGELGFKTGKGFYDYTGVNKAAVIAKRDKQLFEVFKIAKQFMDDPV